MAVLKYKKGRMFCRLDQLEGYYYYHSKIEKVCDELPKRISQHKHKNQMFFVFGKGEMLSNVFFFFSETDYSTK